MNKSAQIRERLRKLAAEVGPKGSMLAKVTSVNEIKMTCDLYDEDTKLYYYDVRLRPVIDNTQSLTLIPKDNTWALAVRIEDYDDWMIVAAGEIDKFLIKCGSLEINSDSVKINSNSVEINDGSKGGLVNWTEVKKELKKTNAVLQAVVDTFNEWVFTPNDDALALKTKATEKLTGATLGDFDGSSLIDDKVKH